MSVSAIELLSLACDSFFDFFDFLAAFFPRNFLNSSPLPPKLDESNSSLSNAGNGGGGDAITFVRFWNIGAYILDDFLSLVVEPIGLQFAAEDFSLVVLLATPLLVLFEEALAAPPPFMAELLFLRLFFCELLLVLNLLFLLFVLIGRLLP